MPASAMEKMFETILVNILTRVAPGVTLDDLKKKASDFLTEWNDLKIKVEDELKNEYDARITELESFVTKMKEAFPEHFEEPSAPVSASDEPSIEPKME